ncbi:unnamed protein product [Ilex paraguariensis]|uniref:Uncharacterized protein n=1 Tax=Ilex paraguariensis TaxID=185542 RepID=A0ABC8RSB0_9AQUA
MSNGGSPQERVFRNKTRLESGKGDQNNQMGSKHTKYDGARSIWNEEKIHSRMFAASRCDLGPFGQEKAQKKDKEENQIVFDMHSMHPDRSLILAAG